MSGRVLQIAYVMFRLSPHHSPRTECKAVLPPGRLQTRVSCRKLAQSQTAQYRYRWGKHDVKHQKRKKERKKKDPNNKNLEATGNRKIK